MVTDMFKHTHTQTPSCAWMRQGVEAMFFSSACWDHSYCVNGNGVWVGCSLAAASVSVFCALILAREKGNNLMAWEETSIEHRTRHKVLSVNTILTSRDLSSYSTFHKTHVYISRHEFMIQLCIWMHSSVGRLSKLEVAQHTCCVQYQYSISCHFYSLILSTHTLYRIQYVHCILYSTSSTFSASSAYLYSVQYIPVVAPPLTSHAGLGSLYKPTINI